MFSKNCTFKPYTRNSIERLNPNQNGVYGIYVGINCIYVGKGDIRERMLVHFDGDNPCINRRNPDRWIGEIVVGDPSNREKELIFGLNPICNQRVG